MWQRIFRLRGVAIVSTRVESSPVHGASRASGIRPAVDGGFGRRHNLSLIAPFTGLLDVRLQPFNTRGVAMSRNYYSEINLHLAWHTKAALPCWSPRSKQSCITT
jgi:hypothetical protein